MANGRFMVNCGGVGGGPSAVDGSTDQETSSDESWLLKPAVMIILSYNSRGLGRGVKWAAIRRTIIKYKVDIACFSTTKIQPCQT